MAAALLLSLVAACGPKLSPSPMATATSASTPIAHAPQIRFALIGQVSRPNVWSLFDSSGYSYNNYAVRSAYWPRLYDLSVPNLIFEPRAATGAPSPVRQEGTLYTATVNLNPSLKWSDGSPFTAEDVAFTVNTALAFQLGFDWQAYYDPAWLDHVEAADARTVKYFFKQMPNVGVWQYGALQGPVVQDQFWSSAVAKASALLPPADLVAQMTTLKAKVADLEAQVGVLNYSLTTGGGEGARQVQSGLKKQQGDLDQAINQLTKAQSEYDSALNAARAQLFGLSDQGEPLLGAWSPITTGSTASSVVENKPNPGYPGSAANFDRAVYQIYPTRAAAAEALQAGQVDVVLDTADSAIEDQPASDAGTGEFMKNPSRSTRFLVFNTGSGILSSAPLRQALACMLSQDDLVGALSGQGIALKSFVAPQDGAWYNPNATLPCKGLGAAARLTQAVQTLKAAGFSWTEEPSGAAAGVGLTSADGRVLPSLELLVPASDPVRTAAGEYIQEQARQLGIPLAARSVPPDAIDYAVFSSHSYDMALLGWKLGLYPGFLCDWFADGKPFQYGSNSVDSACKALGATSSLDQAAQQAFKIQASLAQDVPFVPLYSAVTYDARGKIDYPFREVLGGLAEVYGAPNLAFPVSP